MCISFGYQINNVRNIMEDIKAPVFINIEIEKKFANDVSILASLESGNRIFPSFLNNTDTHTVILNASSYTGNANPPFIRALSLRIPKEKTNEILASIKSISRLV